MAETPPKITRREVVAQIARGAGLLAVGGVLGSLATRGEARPMVWQIDPAKCTQCGKCATECVLAPSAAKCVHEHAMCGYCELCFGYFQDQRPDNSTAAENQRCPTGAITVRPTTTGPVATTVNAYVDPSGQPGTADTA